MAEKAQYPIGEFKMPKTYTEADVNVWMESLKKLPTKISKAIKGIDADDLDTPYREGGWTIKQVIHHLADSHMFGYMRIKRALTENEPFVHVYDQDSWAWLIDAEDGDVEPSLRILEGIHQRMDFLFNSLRHGEFKRAYKKDAEDDGYEIWQAIAFYSWHANHHLEHIKLGVAAI